MSSRRRCGSGGSSGLGSGGRQQAAAAGVAAAAKPDPKSSIQPTYGARRATTHACSCNVAVLKVLGLQTYNG